MVARTTRRIACGAAIAVAVVSGPRAFPPAPVDAADVCPSTSTSVCVPIWPHQWSDYDWMTGRGFSTDAQPCPFQSYYGYCDHIAISSSSTDPNVNSGPILDDTLYLWAYFTSCVGAYGYRGDGFTSFQGDLRVIGFEGDGTFTNGVVHWSWPEWCVNPNPYLVGRLRVELPVAVESHTWGRMKSLYR